MIYCIKCGSESNNKLCDSCNLFYNQSSELLDKLVQDLPFDYQKQLKNLLKMTQSLAEYLKENPDAGKLGFKFSTTGFEIAVSIFNYMLVFKGRLTPDGIDVYHVQNSPIFNHLIEKVLYPKDALSFKYDLLLGKIMAIVEFEEERKEHLASKMHKVS